MEHKFKTTRYIQEEEGGLQSTADRYYLLKLVERVGKGANFTPRMVDLLAYYLRFTRECDWEEGSRPVVYQSLSKTALDLGVSERQIQKLEKALSEVGALTWHDSGNLRRYGQRCPKSGKILYAFGVDLSPLAELEESLTQLLEEKETYARSWMEAKRQISFYRRQVKALLGELTERPDFSHNQATLLEKRYQAIAMQIRTHLKLSRLQSLLVEHRELFLSVKALAEQGTTPSQACAQTEEVTLKNEEKFVHNKDTNQIPFNKLKTGRAAPSRLARGKRGESRTSQANLSVTESQQDQRREEGPQSSSSPTETSQGSGQGKLSLNQIINASSSRFRESLPLTSNEVNEHHLVDAADRLRGILQISKGSWSRACQSMGRVGAAICLMLTDQAALRETNPARIPGAYFNALIKRSQTGELNLTSGIFAALKRQESRGLYS
ncbi:replication initiation protein RepC [Roseibacillus persicicus]|uniref:replication initiation protein RepC n=1 Tax=Roseibacillus persicicus TaxID=454148 RepID=UPI00398AEAA4